MSLLNYSASAYLATPAPATTHFYQPVLQPQYQQQPDHGPYNYPRPPNPFLREDFESQRHTGHKTTHPFQTTIHQHQTHHPPSPQHPPQVTIPGPGPSNRIPDGQQGQRGSQEGHPPLRPIQYERVTPVTTRTSLHPIIDYDEDYYDDVVVDHHHTPVIPAVTPIQGPIYIKNGSVPVVPLYSYPVLNNGTFVQIPVSVIFYIFNFREYYNM